MPPINQANTTERQRRRTGWRRTARHRWLCVLLAVAVLRPTAGPAFAQALPFPPVPTTATEAARDFNKRARAVIEWNACGREDDYQKFRNQMARGDFSKGEDLAHILTAKIAYVKLSTPATFSIRCIGRMFRSRPKKNDGTFVHATYEAFEKDDRDVRDAGPDGCFEETEQRRLDDPAGTLVALSVDAGCMSDQIDHAILSMRKTTVMGTSGLPCAATPRLESDGEYDVIVRELIRILYLAGPNSGRREGGILAPKTIDHMYDELLAARGALSNDTYSVAIGCSEPADDAVGSPEDTADRHAWYNELANFLGDLFAWLAKTYVEYSLLSGVGGLAAMPFLFISDAAGEMPGDIRVPETENHRLNIESSKFLTNADIIARLEDEGYEGADDVRKDQAEVRAWLMQRLHDIAINDFQEYNARPYTRYSLNSILNLNDFAAVHGDTALAAAAGLVLDLSAAKFAATSNRGRRIVPFRRRSGEDGDEDRYLYESIQGADHEVARAMLLSGQTQLLDIRRFDHEHGTLAEMVNGATSPYRLPFPVLVTAVERGAFNQLTMPANGRHMFEQTVKHTGVERVFQSPAFTISAGGVRTDATARMTLLEFSSSTDRGVAMPTVIIPTVAGAYMKDLFRFEGAGVHDERTDNTCVAPGFACGIKPKLSEAFGNCTEKSVTSQQGRFFVDSIKCFPETAGPHFYLAAEIAECAGGFCPPGTQWGLMDIVEAAPLKDGQPDPAAFPRFRAERNDAFDTAVPDAEGNGTYRSAAGNQIGFSVMFFPPFKNGPFIRTIDGQPPAPWLTAGDAMQADGRGRVTLTSPGVTMTLDFSDPNNPRRGP